MNTIKYKYVVIAKPQSFDENGKFEYSQPFEFEFNDGSLADMRIAALTKANELYEMFGNMPSGQEFHSPWEAGIMKMKNVRTYSLDVIFFIDEFDYQIIGDDELKKESKEVEKAEFKKLKIKYPKRKEYLAY